MSAAMSGPARRRRPIGDRPAVDPVSAWVQQDGAGAVLPKAARHTARLTLDVTPALRRRIKLAAFGRDITAAAMLRELLEQAFPGDGT